MKIGILGAGSIAGRVCGAITKLDSVELYAVASRSLEKAKAFAAQYGAKKAYGSYEQMLADPKVELVYIATPHSHHFAHMQLCLAYGKHILCEKAFTQTAAQAKEIIALAREKGVYLAEAIWTRYMPSRYLINEVIESGIIGKVSTLTANLSYPISTRPRITDPNLAGGALLDIGIYGLNFALMHFGKDYSRIETSVQMLPSGVDGMETITIFYEDGRSAVLTHSVYGRSDRKGIFYGEKGYIIVENINNPQSIQVFDLDDQMIASYAVPPQINGYEYEFVEAEKCIREGLTESKSMPLDETLYVMELMDSIRAKWGMVYPIEK